MSNLSEIEDLKKRLLEAENNVHQAAVFGKQLLEENHELHTKLEEASKNQATLEV